MLRRLSRRRHDRRRAEADRQQQLTRATYDALLHADAVLAESLRDARLAERLDGSGAAEFPCLIRLDDPAEGEAGWKPGWLGVTEDTVLWTCANDPDSHEGLRYQCDVVEADDGRYYFEDILEDPDAADTEDWWDAIASEGDGETAVAANRNRCYAQPITITFARLPRDDWSNEVVVRADHDSHDDLIELLSS